MSESTNCMECGRPWGVILDRGELPSEKAQFLAQTQLEEELMQYLEDGLSPDGEVVNLTGVPQVEAEEIVFITEATAAFASEYLNCDMMPESACWSVVGDVDLPAWLLKGRKRRWAYRWDCCNLDLYGFVVKAPARVWVSSSRPGRSELGDSGSRGQVVKMTRAQAVEHNRIFHEGLCRIGMCAEDEILGDEAARDAGVALPLTRSSVVRRTHDERVRTLRGSPAVRAKLSRLQLAW
jgi:hypothetical protein